MHHAVPSRPRLRRSRNAARLDARAMRCASISSRAAVWGSRSQPSSTATHRRARRNDVLIDTYTRAYSIRTRRNAQQAAASRYYGEGVA
ncbi:hypothetical protein PSPO01_15625 [Paraphaeosphaeria sporulosa]